jgi:hypothetical protein
MDSTDQNYMDNKAKRLVTSGLHPGVYVALIALSLWFVVWVWSFLGGGETSYLLFVVSGFIGVVIALQLILSLVTRPSETTSQNTAAADAKETSFAPGLAAWRV